MNNFYNDYIYIYNENIKNMMDVFVISGESQLKDI